MFTVDEVLATRYPGWNKDSILNASLRHFLRRLLHEDAFNDFARTYPHLQGMDFVEQVLDHFQFGYTLSDRDKENIPPTGRVVIIANHPIGTLDGLAMLKMVHEVRSDVRIVANDLLMYIKPLHPCLLPVNNMEGKTGKKELTSILKALKNEEAIIIFPAGEVSRLRPTGVKDCKWQRGFLSIAGSGRAPIVPVHINGFNSRFFYTTSLICKPLSTMLLIGEMFKQQKKCLGLKVGKVIPHSSYQGLPIRDSEKVKLFKKHLYRIGKNKKPIFRTQTPIALPERRSELRKALEETQLLGQTPDHKQIFLYSAKGSSPILREIGRLREITFRAVEEGTGKRRDMDRFDSTYQHLILWDDKELEIVGAYRFTDSQKIINKYGLKGLYTKELFCYDQSHRWFLKNGMELGRSFVQQRYWGKRSLDYLWYGIGAFLKNNPYYRYLFGPVSLSGSMPRAGKELLISFYKLYFGTETEFLCSRNPFQFSQPTDQLTKQFLGDNYKKDIRILKTLLSNMGCSIPTLYKQYSELCKPGGVQFLDFNVDPDFNNCVDGLVVVDLTMLKDKKRQRYIENSILTQ